MGLVNKVVSVLMFASLGMFFLGSIGALVHSLESKRMGWVLSFFCIPGATVLYVVLHKAEARAQWVLMKYGFFVLLCALVLIGVLAFAS